MKRLFAIAKTALLVCLAGLLLVVNTACSNATTKAKATDGGELRVPGQVQPYEGGINNFRDVDPTRLDTTGPDAKAKALKDTVERNIKTKGIENPDDLVDNIRTGTPLPERVKRIGDDLREGTENIVEDAQTITDRGGKNLKRNLDKAPEAIDNTVERAKSNAKQAGRDVVEGAQDLGEKAGKVGQRASEFANDKANEAARAIDKAA